MKIYIIHFTDPFGAERIENVLARSEHEALYSVDPVDRAYADQIYPL